MPHPTAPIDRRIKVTQGLAEDAEPPERISGLRAAPFVVLLGEPGMGKSTVLQTEAAVEQTRAFKVQPLTSGIIKPNGGVLYIDALDEFRSDGAAEDKIYSLAKVIVDAGVTRWRLTCRSEDWFDGPDLDALELTTGGAPIVVAQLMPLETDEAIAILTALGAADPQAFGARAVSLGAAAFLENPLSLELLFNAVEEGGAWPKTRYELFRAAVRQLSFEKNKARQRGDRASAGALVELASRTCLLLLAAGAPGIWRNHDVPAVVGDRAYLNAAAVGAEATAFTQMLDTPLFRGEGATFEPMHRTIAEFLGGQALAAAVAGGSGRSPLPLQRALSFITGEDGAPPSELRGFYAWFAVHLAQTGLEEAALEVVSRDAATVLAYGDAAAFSTPIREALFLNLDREDPYFRSALNGETTLGPLAGEDLAPLFRTVLETYEDPTHRTVTVLDALTHGQPVQSLRPSLYTIATDANRPGWIRSRAVKAWLNGASDPVSERRRLFDALADEAGSPHRETLRIELAAELVGQALPIADVKQVVGDFDRSDEDNVVMRLYPLRLALQDAARPELFDEPVANWRAEAGARRHNTDVDDFLDAVLAATIRATPELDAPTLLTWFLNVHAYPWSGANSAATAAVQAWLSADAKRETELFLALLERDSPDRGAWVVNNEYTGLTKRSPSAAIVERMLEDARVSNDPAAAAERRLAVAVYVVRQPDAPGDLYWRVYDAVEASEYTGLLEILTVDPSTDWRAEDRVERRRRDTERDVQRQKQVEAFEGMAADLRAGRAVKALDWGACLYFVGTSGQQDTPTLDHIVRRSDQASAEAMIEGWKRLAIEGAPGVDAKTLGQANANSKRFYMEIAALAGLDLLLEAGEAPEIASMSMTTAIAVLKSNFSVHDSGRRDRLLDWAIDRIGIDAQLGAEALVAFWGPILDGGGSDLPGLGPVLNRFEHSAAGRAAVLRLLDTRRVHSAHALRLLLRFAVDFIAQDELARLAAESCADTAVPEDVRAVWNAFAFLLDPDADMCGFRKARTAAEAAQHMAAELEWQLPLGQLRVNDALSFRRDMALIRLLACGADPDREAQFERETPAGRQGSFVQNLIERLAANPASTATRALTELAHDPQMAAWQANLRHALAQQRRLARDRSFRHPAAAALTAALQGGAPLNAADLRAVVTHELRYLQRTTHTGDTTPWKRYWNTNSSGAVTEPKVENQCRDALLERLRDRLLPYGIAVALPEARQGEETRADILILSAAAQLPIEAKRHYHQDLWIAASTQLQGYSACEGADGFGVYLVFWFGLSGRPLPARPDGATAPQSAAELERLLVQDLPSSIQARTDVVVMDVSPPCPTEA